MTLAGSTHRIQEDTIEPLGEEKRIMLEQPPSARSMRGEGAYTFL